MAMIVGNLLSITEPPVPYIKNWNIGIFSPKGFCQSLTNLFMHVKHPKHYLPFNRTAAVSSGKPSINMVYCCLDNPQKLIKVKNLCYYLSETLYFNFQFKHSFANLLIPTWCGSPS